MEETGSVEGRLSAERLAAITQRIMRSFPYNELCPINETEFHRVVSSSHGPEVLSVNEETALQHLQDVSRERTSHHSQDTLLCTVFMRWEESAISAWDRNVLSTAHYCDWAVVLYRSGDACASLSEEIRSHFKRIVEEHKQELSERTFPERAQSLRLSRVPVLRLVVCADMELQREEEGASTSARRLAADIVRLRKSSGGEGRLRPPPVVPGHRHIPKPTMYHHLLPIAREYRYVWLLDEDVSVEGFDLSEFLQGVVLSQRGRCRVGNDSAVVASPLLVAQPLVSPNTQDRTSVSFSQWYVEERLLAENEAVQVQYTGFVEQQAPLFDTEYFEWYTTMIIEPMRHTHLQWQSGWGPGHTNCKAAESYANAMWKDRHPNAPVHACGIVLTHTPITHLDTHAIGYKIKNRALFNRAGHYMMRKYQSAFPNWNMFGKSYGMVDPADKSRMIGSKNGKVVWDAIQCFL